LPGTSWSFSFVQLTDVHIGEAAPDSDYGTPGLVDSPPRFGVDDEGLPADRLRVAVRWINEHIADEKIAFVVVTGDLTDSAEWSEYLKVKEILDSLQVPYIPMIGNHDMWPYTGPGGNVRSQGPTGDSLLNAVFADTFDSLALWLPGWQDGTRLNRVANPQAGGYPAYFQNYHFRYGNYQFVCTDFGSREAAPNNLPGVGPPADLFNFAGGSLPWLEETLGSLPNGQGNVLLFGHWPFNRFPLHEQYGFTLAELDTIHTVLKPYRGQLGGAFTGHIHLFAEQKVTAIDETTPITDARWTGANKEFELGHFRLVRVHDGDAVLSRVDQAKPASQSLGVYPNPASTYCWLRLPTEAVGKPLEVLAWNELGQLAWHWQSEENVADALLRIEIPTNTAPGLYTLQVLGASMSRSTRLIIQHP
jgi:hypothetical protein